MLNSRPFGTSFGDLAGLTSRYKNGTDGLWDNLQIKSYLKYRGTNYNLLEEHNRAVV